MERAHGIRGCSEPPRMGIAGRRGIVEALQGRQGKRCWAVRADRGAPAGLPAHRGGGMPPQHSGTVPTDTWKQVENLPVGAEDLLQWDRVARPGLLPGAGRPGGRIRIHADDQPLREIAPLPQGKALCGSTAASRPELSDKRAAPNNSGRLFQDCARQLILGRKE